MRRVLLALGFVVAFASGVWADKAVTFSTVVLTDVTQVCFRRAGSGWRAQADAVVRGSGGNSYTTTIQGPTTGPQSTAIETYITNNVLTPLNTQEGL